MANSLSGFLDRHHFTLRRLHSLSGIIPIGAFLINHLLANSTLLLGEEPFNHHIDLIHGLPWLLGIEIVFIFIPLAFHGLLGIAIAWQGKVNQSQYPYMDNWRYTLQRVTAYVTIVFVLLHLVHFRFAHWFGIAAPYAAAHHAEGGFYAFTIAGFHDNLMGLPTWVWMVIYAIGLVAAVYHLCNGLVTFCITWGIIVGDASRRRTSLVAGGLGLVLLFWGVASLYAAGRRDPQTSGAMETHAAAGQVFVTPPTAQGSGC